MAGRPSKALLELTRDFTFRARRHHRLLAAADVPYPAFAAIQARYRDAGTETERRAAAIEYERLVSQARDEATRAGVKLGASLAEDLADLPGEPGSPENLCAFFPRFLFHTKGPKAGQRFKLEPYEQAFLTEFFLRDRRGERIYTRGLFGGPKGIGKTPLLSGVMLYSLVTERDSPELYQIAGSKQQAGIGLGFSKTWAADGELAPHLTVGSTIRCDDTGGVYQVLSSDGRLAQGVMPTGGGADEWWLFQTARERETYLALQNALHKRPGKAWLLATSTAGWDLSSQLGETWQAAVAHPRLEEREGGCLLVLADRESGFLMHWWHVPEGGDIEDPAVLRRALPASWIRPKDLLRQLHQPGVDELDFRRLNGNQWTQAKGAWIPAPVWDALADDVEIPEGATVAVAADAALTYDTTAVAWAWLAENGRVVLRSRVWSVRADAPAHVHPPGDRLDNEETAEAFIRELASRHRVEVVVCDRRFFATEAKHLADAGLTVVELEQGSRTMNDAVQEFYPAVMSGRVCHDGDPVLREHVRAAAAKKTERGWRVFKQEASNPIDALTAAIMAHYGATRLVKGPRKPPEILWL